MIASKNLHLSITHSPQTAWMTCTVIDRPVLAFHSWLRYDAGSTKHGALYHHIMAGERYVRYSAHRLTTLSAAVYVVPNDNQKGPNTSEMLVAKSVTVEKMDWHPAPKMDMCHEKYSKQTNS